MDKPYFLPLKIQGMHLLDAGIRSGVIIITECSQYRGNSLQVIQNSVAVNITAVENQVYTLECCQYLRGEFLLFPGNMCI